MTEPVEMFRGGSMTIVDGRDGFLFLDEFEGIEVKRLYTEPGVLPDAALLSWAETLRRRRAYFDAAGIVDVTFVVPDAYLVYADKLPDHLELIEATPFARLDAMLDAPVRDQVVYPLAQLLEGRQVEETYQSMDSHWTDWGAYLGYCAVMAHLAPRVPNVHVVAEDEITWSERTTYGALGAMMTPERTAVVPIAQVKDAKSYVALNITTEVRHGYKVTEQDRPDLPTAVIFRDSFMTAAGQFFSESFRRVVYVAAGETIHYDLIEREQPDVVIHQMGERRLTSVPNEPSTWDFRATFGDLLLDDPKAIADERRSRSLLKAGKLIEALGANTKVLAAVRPNARVLLHRGRIHLAMGRLDAAIETMRHATVLDPTDAFLFFALGQALGKNGRVVEALAACEQAILIEPRQDLYWPQAIVAALQAADADRAGELVAMALTLFPDRADMHYIDSCVLGQLGLPAKAEDAIRRAAALDPDTRLYRRQLASILVQLERWVEAHQLLTELHDEVPDEPGLPESLAHVDHHLSRRPANPPLAGTR